MKPIKKLFKITETIFKATYKYMIAILLLCIGLLLYVNNWILTIPYLCVLFVAYLFMNAKHSERVDEANEANKEALKRAIKNYDNLKNGNSPCVPNRYLFWFENEGKKGWTFEIEANDYNEAYEKAYNAHGSQVKDMMYKLL